MFITGHRMPSRRNTKTVSKRTTTESVPRAPKLKVRSVKRTAYAGPLQSAGATAQVAYGSSAFTLNSLPNYTDFTSLFDQYRITKVSMYCIPRVTGYVLSQTSGSVVDPTAPTPACVFHYAIDHTDVTTPSALGDILQYDNHRTVNAYKPFTITLKPAAADTMWQGVSASGYGPKPNAWIDSKSYAVQHYGMKWAWQCNSDYCYLDVYTTYWVDFKEPN